MTALLFYYFLYVVGAIVFTLLLYKVFDIFIDWFVDLINSNTRR